MSKRFGLGGLFRKTPETHGPETQEEESATEAVRERLAREVAAGIETTDDLDAGFREALADGEIAGDIVAVDARGRAVKGRKRSNIFGA